jgi:hypothetical protein
VGVFFFVKPVSIPLSSLQKLGYFLYHYGSKKMFDHMEKRKFYVIALLLWLCFPLRADEGMWLPLLVGKLIERDMQAKGFKLTAEDIYSVNKASMKDGIVLFGRGCTGELISGSGLLITNHHCGYGSIQSQSSVEKDYLTWGFWAMSPGEELPIPGLTVTFLISMEDVTVQALLGVKEGMAENERNGIIARNTQRIREEAVKGTSHQAIVKDLFYGNEYYLFVTQTYRDVRLVGAPPSSIGKFGGDTDNWMWPRHTGDFALFRVYAAPDNSPADFAAGNVPYKPAHHFPISLKPIREGDFAMIYGYPGTTQQYIPSQAVDFVEKVSNPVKIAMRETSLALMDQAMRNNDEIRIRYAARYAGISNYHKKWIGENNGLRKLDAVQRKKEQEKHFQARANVKKPEYASLPKTLNQQHEQISRFALARDLFTEMVFYGPQVLNYGYELSALINQYDQLKKEGKLEDALKKMRQLTETHFKAQDVALEKKIFAALLDIYLSKIDPAFKPAQALKTWNGNATAFVEQLYDGSWLGTQEAMVKALEKLSEQDVKKIQKDPLFQFTEELYAIYFMAIQPEYQRLNGEITLSMRQYVKAMMELMPEKKFWPDANMTLRISYGKVEGSTPRDGMRYHHYTTLEGVMEKFNPAHLPTEEFYVPEKLIALHKAKDYGEYAQDGELWVCFTSSLHTTGGNSGSPVIDGEGNLIGINFDRSWESTMSDIMFDPERCRNIVTDMRYVLFVVDKFAGAGYLLNEMTLVREEGGK